MKEIVIKIGGIEYLIKQSFRSLIMFEKLASKKINEVNDNVTDIVLLFYCILSGCNKTFVYTFEEFLDILDENPESIEVFTNYLESQAQPIEETKKKQTKKTN